MKKYFVIETPEQMRVASDPLRIQIITMLIREELTGKQIGELLGHSASRIHYHLKEMEAAGFIHVQRTEEKNGIVQKFYRSVALDFVFSDELLPHLRDDSTLAQESIINHLRQGMAKVYKAPDESFHMFADEKPPLHQLTGEFKLPRPMIKEWLIKYENLLNELTQLEAAYAKQIEAKEVTDLSEVFYLVTVGFMSNEQVFFAEDRVLPEEYEQVTLGVVRKRTKKEKG